ncbi:hypothetical protein GJ629_15825, partial [Halapricum sp. CBA1109]|nr:hypothetical protein [Halapricum sp. CBA1109]
MYERPDAAPDHLAVHGGRVLDSPTEPQLGSIPSGDNDSEAVAETGTTTIGIAATDGVVVATDKRASLGG